VALYLAPASADAGAFAVRALERAPLAPLELFVVSGPDEPVPDLREGAQALVDTDGVLAATYGGPDWLWLIRPDGHLAARRVGMDPAQLPDLVDLAAGASLRSGQRVAADGA
jgi:hypothetical protein